MFRFRRIRVNKKDLFYKISLIAFFFVFIGFIIITPVDTIIQSKQTSQVWNVFIILAAWVIAGLISLLLYGIRIVRSRRILADIPKRYLPRFGDLPKEVSKSIVSGQDRCASIVRMTKPTPTHHSDTELSQNVSLLYDDIIILVGKIIEAKVSNINESFKRVPGLSLREYLILLDSYGIFENLDHDLLMKSYVNGLDQHDDLESDHISNSDDQTFNEGSNGRCRSNRSMNSLDNCSAVMTDSSSQASGFIISGHSEYVASFAELYEELRFSGKPIMEDQFEIFMGMLINLLKNIDFPHFDRQNSTDDSQINRDDAVNAFVGDFNHLYAPSEGGYATGDDISRVTTRLSAIASDRSMQHSKKHTSFYDKQGKKSFNFTKHLHPLNPTDSNLLRKTKTWLSGVSSHKAESKYHYSEAEMSDRRSERSISSGDEYGYSSPASSVIRYTIDDTQSPDQIIGNPRHRLSFPISIHRSQHNMDNTADDRLSRNSSEYEGSVIIRSAE